jgi:hypothetical protein|tara:strand:+ start:601 stop:888 length:288 start_codon:yes stop_codon:yes gene_type:complete
MTTTKETFLRMCHNIYDKIHGKDNINKIFSPISEEQLNTIIHIYTKEFYKRIQLIENFISTIPDIDDRVKIKGGTELNTSAFYLNAMQHYTTGDY